MTYPTRLEECTWKQVRAALDEGYDTVLVMTASIEQHGPHLPTITDTQIGDALAARIAARLGRTFAAPVLRPGLSAHHMVFPGSFTLRPETFRLLLEDYCLSLARHGFRRLILMSSHGGNFAAIHAAAPEIEAKLAAAGFPARVLVYADLDGYVATMQGFLEPNYGGTPEESSGHADMAETALMLALRPELVDMSRAEPGWMGNLADVGDRLWKDGLHSLSQNGILGDPRRATAEMGRGLLDYIVEQMTEGVKSLIANDTK